MQKYRRKIKPSIPCYFTDRRASFTKTFSLIAHFFKDHFILKLFEKCTYSEFFWSLFSRIWTEYSEILRISPYSVQMLGKKCKIDIYFIDFQYSVQFDAEYWHHWANYAKLCRNFSFSQNFQTRKLRGIRVFYAL